MTTSEEFGVAAFQRFLDQHKLAGARCHSCGALHVPPRPRCPKCQGTQMGWEELRTEAQEMTQQALGHDTAATVARAHAQDRAHPLGRGRIM